MEPLRVCLASQTPPMKFLTTQADLVEKYPDAGQPLDAASLQQGVDCMVSSGGVSRMLRHLLRKALSMGLWKDVRWVSLNPTAPPEYLLEGARMHSVSLDPAVLQAYAMCKEKMWAEIHGLPVHGGPIRPEEFRAFTMWNWRTAREMFGILGETDVAFVHDFQLLQQGSMIGLAAPVVLRWHGPFAPERWTPYFRNYVARVIEDFDGVIVSCKRDLEGLMRVGYRGIARQVYPYLDLDRALEATPEARAQLAAKLPFQASAPVILCVSRMDPIKGQNRLIAAMANVLQKVPEAHLLLVGNGSFTSSGPGGLGHSKGVQWRSHLERTVQEHDISHAVHFTGYLSPELLDAAWERAGVVVQPSVVEGFGLTAVEAWLHQRCAIVSRGAGARELIIDGINGYSYDTEDTGALAGHILEVLGNPTSAARMARRGRETARLCSLESGARQETRVLQEAVDGFRRR